MPFDRNAQQNPLSDPPSVSVIVCTRNRGDNALTAARAILASDYADFELLIMDQSDDDLTRLALEPLCEQDERLRYFRLELPGKPGALNRARQEARGRWLALTDDDCRPDSCWLRALLAAFEADPRIGAVFGDVRAAPYDSNVGYIPDNPIVNAQTIYSVREFLYMPGMVHFGIGANMAVRADAADAVQGWDPCVGPGAKFGNADDHDMALRLLLAGYALAFAPDAHTVHDGFRLWSESARDVQLTGFGFGAAFIKHLRCGKLYHGSLRMLRHFCWQIVRRALKGQRPLGMAFPRGWFRGFAAALTYPVNRANRTFRKMDAAESRKYGGEFAQLARRPAQAGLVGASEGDAPPAPVGAGHAEDNR